MTPRSNFFYFMCINTVFRHIATRAEITQLLRLESFQLKLHLCRLLPRVGKRTLKSACKQQLQWGSRLLLHHPVEHSKANLSSQLVPHIRLHLLSRRLLLVIFKLHSRQLNMECTQGLLVVHHTSDILLGISNRPSVI